MFPLLNKHQPVRPSAFTLLLWLVMWASPGFTDIYHLDINHAGASNSNDGSEFSPWKTAEYALDRLRAGDTLVVHEGVYGYINIILGRSSNGTADLPVNITVYPGDTAVFGDPGGAPSYLKLYGTKFWNINGIVFDNMQLRLGNIDTTASDISVTNCSFLNTQNNALEIQSGKLINISHCNFERVQSQFAGLDAHAIIIGIKAIDTIIESSTFYDVSGDGVQIGENVNARRVTIRNNHFEIRRYPDGSLIDEELQLQWGNTGENGIDIKTTQGPVVIQGNEISGYRPTVPGQNASGARGVGITVHNFAENVSVVQNLLRNNTINLFVGNGSAPTYGPKNVLVENNILKDSETALSVTNAAKIKVYNNTFVDNVNYLDSRNVVLNSKFMNNVILDGNHDVREEDSTWTARNNAWVLSETTIPASLLSTRDQNHNDMLLGSDYTPLSGSPLIDKGKRIRTNLVDHYGNPRSDGKWDIGAVEYQNF